MSAEGWRPPPLRECDTVSCADGRTVPAQTSIPNVLGLTGDNRPSGDIVALAGPAFAAYLAARLG